MCCGLGRVDGCGDVWRVGLEKAVSAWAGTAFCVSTIHTQEERIIMGSKARRAELRAKRRQIQQRRARRYMDAPSFSESVQEEASRETGIDMSRTLTRSQRTILGR